MNKKNLTYLVALLLCVGSSWLTGCGGGMEEPKVIVNNNGSTTTSNGGDFSSLPDSLGGNGFEAWAGSHGWETNSDFKVYADPAAKKGGSITMALNEYPITLRPIGKDSRFQVVSIITSFVYETLLSLDGETQKYIPVLATHWKISDDKMTYYFRLDPRARWSDGKPLSTDDIIESFKLHIDKGIEDPANNTRFGEGYEIPEKVSDLVFKVKSKKESWRSFMDFGSGWQIFPAHYLKKLNGGKDFLTTYQFQMMPGTGPYQLDDAKTKQNELLVLKRRPDYWAMNDKANVGTYNFDEIRFIFVLDDKLMLEKFKKGEFDFYSINRAKWWVEEFDAKNNDNVKRGLIQKVKIFNYNPKGISGLAFNTLEEPFKDIRVREAFTMLWDIEQLRKELFYMEYDRFKSYFPGSVNENKSNSFVAYNPQKALQLLSEAGWKKQGQWLTKNGKIFELDIASDPSLERIITPFQQDLAEVGIKLNLVPTTAQAGFEKVMKRQFKIHQQSWTGTTFPDPKEMMGSESADKKESGNITGLKNKEIDALAAQYEKSYDPAERIKLLQQIDAIAVKQHQYAFGWVAPYTFRGAVWNKFGIPKAALGYSADWNAALATWWYDEAKEKQVEDAKQNKSANIPTIPVDNDFFGLHK
ncbi:MAG: ABC transporter substrate-binding protein [Chitinophagales bacterium]|nr:ABC transporter substrate-binding protein [Chitinophagales bacterium]